MAFGALLFGMGYLGGSMTPTEKDAYARFGKLGLPPDHYRRFNALVYSLENSLPLVKLGQDSYWTPKPNPDNSVCRPTDASPVFAKFAWARPVLAPLTTPGALRWFRWLQILVRWILATLFLAGVSGIVRKD